MSQQIALSSSNLPAFVQQGQSALMSNMGQGMSESTPSISLNGSRFTFIRDGNEIGKSPNTYLDVILVGVSSAAHHRAYFSKTYEPGEVIQPDCSSHNGISPDGGDAKQSESCQLCPKNHKQPDPRRPGKEFTPCGFSKNIAVMIPGDNTNTVWRLKLSSMTLFNSSDAGANSYTWKGLFAYLKSVGASPEHLVLRLEFQSGQSVPVLIFSVVAQVGDGNSNYDQAFYNNVMHEITQATKIDNATGDSANSPVIANPAPVITETKPEPQVVTENVTATQAVQPAPAPVQPAPAPVVTENATATQAVQPAPAPAPAPVQAPPVVTENVTATQAVQPEAKSEQTDMFQDTVDKQTETSADDLLAMFNS